MEVKALKISGDYIAEERYMENKESYMTRIKLCGLRRAEDIQYVNELLPEYIGFVFAKESRRYVTKDEARLLKCKLDNRISAVGVFVNETIENIAKLLNENIIDMVQLHGNENEEYISSLRQVKQCTIIKAFRVRNRADVLKALNSPADYVLLDSGSGSGEAFDWSVLEKLTREIKIDRPYFLAGGLEPSNVRNAISRLKPFAVDASSSLEADGYKDREKMKAFVMAVREDKAL